jgi:hypothetical protein
MPDCEHSCHSGDKDQDLRRDYSDLTFSLPGLDQGDVPLLLAVLSEKQCKDTFVQALLKD